MKQSGERSGAANHHLLLGGGQEQRMNEGWVGGGAVDDLD